MRSKNRFPSIIFALIVGILLLHLDETRQMERTLPTSTPTIAVTPTATQQITTKEIVIGDITTYIPVEDIELGNACNSAVDMIVAYESADRRGEKLKIFPNGAGIEVDHYYSLSGSSYSMQVYPMNPVLIIGQHGTLMIRTFIIRCPKGGVAIAKQDTVENILTVSTSEDFDSCDRDVTRDDFRFDTLDVSSWIVDFEHFNGEKYVHIFLKETDEDNTYYMYFIVELDELVPGYNAWSLKNGITLLIYRERSYVALSAIHTIDLLSVCN